LRLSNFTKAFFRYFRKKAVDTNAGTAEKEEVALNLYFAKAIKNLNREPTIDNWNAYKRYVAVAFFEHIDKALTCIKVDETEGAIRALRTAEHYHRQWILQELPEYEITAMEKILKPEDKPPLRPDGEKWHEEEPENLEGEFY